MFKLNKAITASFMAASAFLAPTAQASEKDANGLNINPTCSERDIFIKAMKNGANKEATGLRAKTADYDLEIFVKIGSDGKPRPNVWTLAGTNKQGQVCALKSGAVREYTEDAYISQLNFKPAAPSTADAKQQPKPQIQ